MPRHTVWVVALAAVGWAFASEAAGQTSVTTHSATAEQAPLVTTNPTLRASLERIAAGSALWRDAVETVRQSGRQVIVATSDQVVVADALDGGAREAFDPSELAAVAPVPYRTSQVRVVLVVVNLVLLEEIHRRRLSVPNEFYADLDRILVHEVYGHALPYLLTGDLSGRCADPLPRQRAVDACSIQRENAVRAELGLGRRTDYGLSGLRLPRGRHRATTISQ
jgi:hypothetical protein